MKISPLWQYSKRLFFSLLGGILLLVGEVAFTQIFFALHGDRTLPSPTSPGLIFMWLNMWPLFVFEKILPPPQDCMSCSPTIEAVYATVIFDIAFHTLVAYVFFWLFDRYLKHWILAWRTYHPTSIAPERAP